MLPNYIGIGAPKAGTTWLAACLAEHPEVFLAAVKETNFFDYTTIDGRLGEYEAHFNGSEGFNAVGEFCTRYLTSIRAPERIKILVPNVRLVVSLRNPIEQVNSHYWHFARQNFHQWNRANRSLSIDEALNSYPHRLLEPGLYAKHLGRWLQYFERDKILVLLYDDIQKYPERVLSSLYAFVGVKSDFIPLSLRKRDLTVRQGTSPRSPAMARMHSVLYGMLNRRIYYPLKAIIGPRRAVRIKDKLQVRQAMEQIFYRTGYPALRLKTRERLRKFFSDDVLRLELLLDRKLSHWLSEENETANESRGSRRVIV